MSLPQAGLLQPREAARGQSLRQRLFRARRMAASTASGRLPVPPACSSAAPGTCVKQAGKKSRVDQRSLVQSLIQRRALASSSSAASVPTAACRIRSSPARPEADRGTGGSETAACRTVRRRKTPGSLLQKQLAQDPGGKTPPACRRGPAPPRAPASTSPSR